MSDLISRQNAIDVWDKLSKRGRTEFDQVLMTLPSAPEPSRQRGEWVHNDKIGTFKIFTCDKCGCNMDTDAWNFCPNCGADMRGGEDDADE